MVDPTENPVALGGAANEIINGKLAQMMRRMVDFGFSQEWWDFVRAHNIALDKVQHHCGIVSVAMCRAIETSTGHFIFEFNSSGNPAVVIEALGFRRESGNTNPSTCDLVAWPLGDANFFATALGPGEGCEMLGAWPAIRPKGVPLRIFADPLSWMKANCEGVVPLKWPEAGHWLHLAGGPFICDDQLHAEEIYNLLYPFGDHHELYFSKR